MPKRSSKQAHLVDHFATNEQAEPNQPIDLLQLSGMCFRVFPSKTVETREVRDTEPQSPGNCRRNW